MERQDFSGKWRTSRYCYIPHLVSRRMSRWKENVQGYEFAICATTADPMWAIARQMGSMGSSADLSGRGIAQGDMCTGPGYSP